MLVKKETKPQIDLRAEEGNAFVLLGYAQELAKLHGKDGKKISEEMTSGEYDHLVEVFIREFGQYVDIIK